MSDIRSDPVTDPPSGDPLDGASDNPSEIRSGRGDDLHRELPETQYSRRLDGLIRAIGEKVSWVWIVLLATIVLNVIMRYVFGEGRIEFEELQWHLYAVGFLAGVAYGVESDDHVRVDFLRARLPLRMQAWIELYGLLLLLFPFIALIVYYSIPFIAYSFRAGEVSPAPGGLPLRWLIKSALLAGFVLLGLAGFSRLLRVSSYLFGSPEGLFPDAREIDRDEDS